jgi:uncharacterized protein YqjF (DUF2071 family)
LFKDNNGWEKLEKSFRINQAWPGKELKIYVWNQGNDTIYFDDLKISREVLVKE